MLRRFVWALLISLPLFAISGPILPALHKWLAGDVAGSLELLERQRMVNPLAELNLQIAQVLLLERELGSYPFLGQYGALAAGTLQNEQLADSLHWLSMCIERASAPMAEAPRSLGKLYQARALLMRADTLQALDLLEEAMRINPHPQTISNPLMLGCLCYSDWRRLENVTQLQKRERPDNPMVWYSLAELAIREGANERALEHLQTSIDIYPLERALLRGIRLAASMHRQPLTLDWLHLLRYRYGHTWSNARLREFCDTLELPGLFGMLGPVPGGNRWQRKYPQFFPVGREWVYKARYGIIPLGQLVVGVRGHEVVERDSTQIEAYRVYYKIDSNPIYRLLIDLHDTYESLIPAHCMANLEFNINSVIAESQYELNYKFDIERGGLRIRGYNQSGILLDDEYQIAREMVDGLTLLFAGRRQVVEREFGPVLTIVDEEPHRTVIEDDGRDWQRIMGQRRAVRKLHGRADYDGLAGLTGEFWGALSDDEEALPLYARFQIGLGKITLELSEIREQEASVEGPRRP